mgnify:CR=1 FL=1
MGNCDSLQDSFNTSQPQYTVWGNCSSADMKWRKSIKYTVRNFNERVVCTCSQKKVKTCFKCEYDGKYYVWIYISTLWIYRIFIFSSFLSFYVVNQAKWKVDLIFVDAVLYDTCNLGVKLCDGSGKVEF